MFLNGYISNVKLSFRIFQSLTRKKLTGKMLRKWKRRKGNGNGSRGTGNGDSPPLSSIPSALVLRSRFFAAFRAKLRRHSFSRRQQQAKTESKFIFRRRPFCSRESFAPKNWTIFWQPSVNKKPR